MRAQLENADGTFVAAVEVPAGTAYVRFGERFFVAISPEEDVLTAVEVYSAPIEGSRVEP